MNLNFENCFSKSKYFVLTSCARKRNRVSSTASFLVVSVLSRNDVRRTDCALKLIVKVNYCLN